jgi:hypothetical protein
MGIGVYQVRRLVRGDVEVRSELGFGTTIRLRLQVAKG